MIHDVNPELIELIRPGCLAAVNKAVHNVDPAKYHERISGVCVFCPSLSDMASKTFMEHAANSPAFKDAVRAISRSMDRQDDAS